MNNEPTLSAKQSHISFQFNDQTSSYESRFTLFNQGQFPIYFRIVSTFGRLLTSDSYLTRSIQPNKSLILSLKLKIPNQINKHNQRLRVSYSNLQLSSKAQLIDDKWFDMGVKFDTTIPEEDPMISEILKGDCEELCQEAGELLKNGLVKKALYKYEESFLLFRDLGSGLYGMAECLYLTECWQEALEQIETALISHKYQNYIWLKLKILFQVIKDGPKSLQTIKGLRKQLFSITGVSNIEEKRQHMLQELSKEEEKIISQKGGKYVAEFIEKALTRYQTDPVLRNLYSSFADYERELVEVLGMRKPHMIEEPPEYILDPITYQIMSQPLIVPSGHSFEPKSLLSYLSKHGSKDLFTRQELRYEWAVRNNALQDFIKNNEHSKQWAEYEQQLGTFK